MKVLSIIMFHLLMLLFLSCRAQKDLSKVLWENRNRKIVLEYRDSSGNYYDRGTYSGMVLHVIFNSVKYDVKKGKVKVNGITSAGFNEKDTAGLCCVHYFLAEPVNGYLTNIRKLGVSNNSSKDSSKPDGFFDFEASISKDDRLYFSSVSGSGLQEFYIGKVCYGKREP
jgi:hypothetical protein